MKIVKRFVDIFSYKFDVKEAVREHIEELEKQGLGFYEEFQQELLKLDADLAAIEESLRASSSG